MRWRHEPRVAALHALQRSPGRVRRGRHHPDPLAGPRHGSHPGPRHGSHAPQSWEPTRADPPGWPPPADTPSGPAGPPWERPPAGGPSGPPPGPPPPGDPTGETTISLSDEPWEHEHWPEPEIWDPSSVRRKRTLPYVLIGSGLVALAAIALTIVFWPGSDRSGTPSANAPVPQSEGAGPQSTPAGDPPSDSGSDLNKQAGQVDALLTEMSSTRSELGSAVTAGCGTADMERIRTQRQEQLGKAKALEVDALDNGTDLRDALVRALEASVESNQRYLDAAPGCPSDDAVRPVNERASAAKREFVGHWRPNAEKAGLAVRDADSI